MTAWQQLAISGSPYGGSGVSVGAASAVTFTSPTGDPFVVVFGGFDAPFFYNATAVFDPVSLKWSAPPVTASPGMTLPARAHHTAVAYGTKMLVFGGLNATYTLASPQLLVLDTVTWMWSAPATTGQVKARAGHLAVRVGDCMILGSSGGEQYAKQPVGWSKLNLTTMKWSDLQFSDPDRLPPPLWRPAYAVVGTSLYVFGGSPNPYTYMCTDPSISDLLVLDLVLLNWLRLKPTGAVPSFVCGPSFAAIGTKLVLTAFGDNSGDVWILDTDTFTFGRFAAPYPKLSTKLFAPAVAVGSRLFLFFPTTSPAASVQVLWSGVRSVRIDTRTGDDLDCLHNELAACRTLRTPLTQFSVPFVPFSPNDQIAFVQSGTASVRLVWLSDTSLTLLSWCRSAGRLLCHSATDSGRLELRSDCAIHTSLRCPE